MSWVDNAFYPTVAQVAASTFAILAAIFATRLSSNREGVINTYDTLEKELRQRHEALWNYLTTRA
jgi:hypothetical protein